MILVIVVAIVIGALCLWHLSRDSEEGAKPLVKRSLPSTRLRVDVPESNGAFSHTRLEKFQNCPKAYEFRYLIRKTEAFGTIETFMGRTIHSVLEWAYRERDNREQTLDLKEVLKQYELLWSQGSDREMKVVKRRASASAYMALGRDMLTAYWNRVFLKDRTETISLEKRFDFEIDDDIHFVGVIDRIARRENGDIVLIDYKTGNPRYITPPEHNPQLHSYATWATTEHSVDELSICIEDLQGKRTLSHTWQTQSRDNVVATIKDQISRIQSTRRFAAKPSILCGWCGYRPFCKEGKAQWTI